MDINTYALPGIGLAELLLENGTPFAGIYRILPKRHGGIARIPWYGHIVFIQKICVELHVFRRTNLEARLTHIPDLGLNGH